MGFIVRLCCRTEDQTVAVILLPISCQLEICWEDVLFTDFFIKGPKITYLSIFS